MDNVSKDIGIKYEEIIDLDCEEIYLIIEKNKQKQNKNKKHFININMTNKRISKI